MKIVLSRKGIDSGALSGKMASPILPCGCLCSIPIPYRCGISYSDVHFGTPSFQQIIRELNPRWSNRLSSKTLGVADEENDADKSDDSENCKTSAEKLVAHNEAYWKEKSPWTLDAAIALLDATRSTLAGAMLNFVKNYIGIEVNGNNYMWLHKRSSGCSLLSCWFSERHLPVAVALLEEAGLAYTKKGQILRISTDKTAITSKAAALDKISELVKKSWEE